MGPIMEQVEEGEIETEWNDPCPPGKMAVKWSYT